MAAAQTHTEAAGSVNDTRTVPRGNNAQAVPQDQATLTASDSQVCIYIYYIGLICCNVA